MKSQKRKVKKLNKIFKEYRSASIEAVEQTDGQLVVQGYAAVFEQPTILFEHAGVQYKEVIDRNAFVGADINDVPFKYNHSDSVLIVARTRNDTLKLEVDEIGLKITASFADTTTGHDLYKLIQRRDIDKMSFGFHVKQARYDSLTHTRRILQFKKIYDVSAVDLPAYDGTTLDISSRSEASAKEYFENMIKQEQEFRRRKMMLMTY